MKSNRNEGVSGVYGEMVQLRQESLRHRHPGRIVSVTKTVVVEYNNYDGHGPYEVEYDACDLERAFAPWCEKLAESDGEQFVCDGLLNYCGDCPREMYHVAEAKR